MAVVVLHVLAALTVVAAPSPGWLLAALPLLAVSGWLNWRSARSPVRLRCDGVDWFLLDPSSPLSGEPATESHPLHWLPSTRIGPHLTLLHAQSAGRRYFWPVASDSLPADEFRRLRVRVGLTSRVR